MRLSHLALLAALARLVCAQSGLPNPMYAYELGDRTPEEQANLLARFGFEGTVFDGATQIERRLAALDAQHLQLFFLWLTVDVSGDAVTFDPGMRDAIRDLAGRDTVIWLAVNGRGPKSEQRAVEAVRAVADLAAKSNLRVALYPHYGFYLARFSEVLRVADEVKRSNVGVTFNLCHELRAGWDPNISKLLVQALPRLYAVTINGADKKGQGWDTLIQPLGKGDFDVAGLVRTIFDAGYRGPIGIQCYGIKGDPALYLDPDRKAWQEISEQVRAGSGVGRGLFNPAVVP